MMRIASFVRKHSQSGEMDFSVGTGISRSSARRGEETLRMKESLKPSLEEWVRFSRGRVSSVQMRTTMITRMNRIAQMSSGVA